MGIAKTLTFGAGETIFKEGERGDVAFIIDKGSVQLTKKAQMKISVIEIVRDGIFALLPLVDQLPRQYTAIAREETVLTIVSREAFEKHLSTCDPAVRAVVHYLTRSLREATNRMMTGGVLDYERGDTY